MPRPNSRPAYTPGTSRGARGCINVPPGWGAGWAPSPPPNPMLIRALNLVSHTVFALGLWGTALLIR
ncbi:DUF2938 family protein [Mesorhizobium sp. M1342]|uniref:DUF2938 family protein n=1 Tax=Mesorhizobium sp. M1342 TaxID=2957088 RepID=UPI00333A9036